MKSSKLTTWIMVGLVLGIVVGYICNISVPNAKAAKVETKIARRFKVISGCCMHSR